MLELAAIFVSFTALFAYLNYRFVGLPPTIGVMAIALACSLLLHGLSLAGMPGLEERVEDVMSRVDFNRLLMDGMLSFILFAGALHVDLGELRQRRWAIGLLATIGVIISTLTIGLASRWILQAFEMDLSLIYCLVFGALIAPTDPIAVLGIMRSAGAPKSLEITIVGESLFNDGVAVVVFTVLVGVLQADKVPGFGEALWLFAEGAGGGILFGGILGGLVFWMLKSIDEYQVEVLLTLALVIGGYTLATHLQLSDPITMVIAGLIIGNHGRAMAMSDKTRRNLDTFWTLIDESLNAVLFVLIGLELILRPFDWLYLFIALCLMLTILAVRFMTVAPPLLLVRFWREEMPKGSAQVLTWGGLRGGISVALALSLPAGDERNLVLNLTYLIVLFSILIQGLTIGRLVRHVTEKSSG
ncbi:MULTISPECIES: cation:proton antiporter [unclassified Pseudomonas]|uniref:cation:proton antiporter n=1 Tax=unclassified Pseudomonas TaxID=196821 RepID=UPI00257ACEB0|nr:MULTISPECIES: sodium:proton antiporter [unclassified Pseudomonas]